MLNNIIFTSHNSIQFEFYHASTGVNLKTLACSGVSIIKYSSALELDEESFPCFVLDITCEKIDKPALSSRLKSIGYSYYQNDGEPTMYESDAYYIFKIQGGAIDVTVICQKFEELSK